MVFVALLLLIFTNVAFAGQPIYGLGPDRVFDAYAHCPLPGLSSIWHPSNYGIAQTIYLKRTQIWVGATYGFRGDIAHELYASNSDDPRIHISNAGVDHYSDVKPMGSMVHNIDWNGDYIRLEPNDSLTFSWSCGAITSGDAEWQVSIWYTLAP